MRSDGSPRLLVAVAHPDDETFGLGSVLLRAADLGATTYVCCATRGEVGEPAPGSGVTQDRLGAVRETELREAARMLNVSRVDLLGFLDSGLSGPAGPDTLAGAELEEVQTRVAACIDELQPDVVVTLDGSDGHRDHIRIRDAVMAVATAPGSPVRTVYYHCVPRTLIRMWLDEQARQNPGSPYLEIGDLGTPDEVITTVLDSSTYFERRERAIAVHASQVSPFAILSPEVRRMALSTDYLQRVVPPWPEGAPPATTLELPNFE
jgi:LmbE family N-acetylglucosaminyl deacetylase